MKSLFVLVFLCFVSFTYSQDQETSSDEQLQKKNEVRLDGIKLIAGTILEGTYEYVAKKNSGMGVSLLVNLDTGNNYNENFSLTPFYRMYFFNKRDYGANGFFVEGFGKLSTGDEESVSDSLPVIVETENYTDFSLGMSLGKKWVNTNGFVFEVLVGVSRSLGGDPGQEAYFRGGLFVGYRF